MATRVRLHIGASKTGSTYLQGLLHGNRDALARQGTLVPGRRLDHYRFMLGVLDRLDDPGRPRAARATYDRIVQRVHDWPRTALISSELMAAATQTQIRRTVEALAPAEVHVIYTARDLARTLPAEWQQAVKGGATLTMSEYVSAVMKDMAGPPAAAQPNVVGETEVVGKFRALHAIDEVLDRWAAVVGEDRVHVVTVPHPGADHDLLWQRFCSTADIHGYAYMLRGVRANASLGNAEAEVLRRVNVALGQRADSSPGLQEWVRHNLALRTLAGSPRSEQLGLHPHENAWAEQRAHKLVGAVNTRGYHVVGDLDDLLPNGDGPTAHPDETDEASISSVAVDVVAELALRLRAEGMAKS